MSTPDDALQGALAAEHAVIWGYDVIGPWAPADVQPAVRAAQAAHESRRDALDAQLRAGKADPVAAQADYELPFPVASATAALKLAVVLEDRCGAAWRYVLESVTDRPLRQQAVAALTATAVQSTRWSREQGTPTTVALPGTP